MTVERSLQQHNVPPTVRRRTPWTKHYKRASSVLTADFDTALKELEFKLVPEPLKVVTNHVSASSDDENYLSPSESNHNSCLLLPLMSDDDNDTNDNPAISLKPILKHSSDRVRMQLSPSRNHDRAEPLLLTPKPTRGFPTMPSTPRKCRKRNTIIDLDTTNAPASIFLPLDL